MDFICLEAGCYPSILHPSSPKMLLEPLEMEATFSRDIHISSCHPLWSRERKCLGTKCLSQGKWVNPALLSPLTSPVPSTSSAPYLWHHFPSDSPIQQHLSSQDPDQVPPLLGCLADHPVPLGLLPFLGYHSQTSDLQSARNYSTTLFHQGLGRGWVIGRFTLELMDPGKTKDFLFWLSSIFTLQEEHITLGLALYWCADLRLTLEHCLWMFLSHLPLFSL